MIVDNASLLIAIAFSSAALMVALLIGWHNARRDTYLVYWSCGIGLVVLGLVALAISRGTYGLVQQIAPFLMLLGGLASVYAGMRNFRRPQASNWPPVAAWAIAAGSMTLSMALGYSGIGTIILNLGAALFVFLCGWECWLGRAEAKAQLTGNSVLFTLSGISFLACAAVLTSEQAWVLSAPPENWAEDFNSIMSLVGLTGIGALSLTLSHARASRRHRDEAHTDSLTGVLNRRALFVQFPEESVFANHAVIMFDLDHFKQINDHLGHAEGDRVLQAFAGILKAELRQSDIAARLGGEEFCVILPKGEMGRDVAERIRMAFAELEIGISATNGMATVSAGLATIGPDEPFSAALSRADAALYKAKSAGRNQVQQANFYRVA